MRLRIPDDQVARAAFEKHIAAVGREAGWQRVAVAAIGARKVDADQRGDSVAAVTEEYVELRQGRRGHGRVCVCRYEVVGGASEKNEAPIGGNQGKSRIAVAASSRVA